MTVAAVMALSVPFPLDRQSQVVPRAPRPDTDGGFFCSLFYFLYSKEVNYEFLQRTAEGLFSFGI